MTDAVREELAPRGIHVAALHVGYLDTDMVSYIPADQKSDPAVVAALALDGLFAGKREILGDEMTRAARAALDECRRQGYQVAVAVVDRFGNPQVLLRDRFAGAHTAGLITNHHQGCKAEVASALDNHDNAVDVD